MMILQEDIILPVAEFKDCLLKKLVEMEVFKFKLAKDLHIHCYIKYHVECNLLQFGGAGKGVHESRSSVVSKLIAKMSLSLFYSMVMSSYQADEVSLC